MFFFEVITAYFLVDLFQIKHLHIETKILFYICKYKKAKTN